MKFLLVVLLATLVRSGVTVDVTEEIKPLLETLFEKNSLIYQDSCDYASEQEKQKYEKQLLHLMSTIRLDKTFDLNHFKNSLIATISSIVKIPSTFCNGYKNLQCNSAGKCDCAAIDESYGFTMSFRREGDACLIVPGSLCAPSELMEQTRRNNPFAVQTPMQEYRCAGHASCIVKRTRHVCTMEAMQAEYKRHLESHQAASSNPVEFLLQKTKEGICVCGSSSALSSVVLVVFSALYVVSRTWDSCKGQM